MAVLFVEDQPGHGRARRQAGAGRDVRTEDVINAATIQGVFSNRFRISGLSVFEAHELALLLRAGSLAAPIVTIEERTIGPSFGSNNIDRGRDGMLIGYRIVVVFIGLWYSGIRHARGSRAGHERHHDHRPAVHLPGAALSLPGIAGILLTVGISVDANVLIIERIREELGNGNSPQDTIRAGLGQGLRDDPRLERDHGDRRSRARHVGTGPIQGFAVALSIGLATSMFTAIIVTRALVNLVYGGRKNLKSLSIGGRQHSERGGRLADQGLSRPQATPAENGASSFESAA